MQRAATEIAWYLLSVSAGRTIAVIGAVKRKPLMQAVGGARVVLDDPANFRG